MGKGKGRMGRKGERFSGKTIKNTWTKPRRGVESGAGGGEGWGGGGGFGWGWGDGWGEKAHNCN